MCKKQCNHTFPSKHKEHMATQDHQHLHHVDCKKIMVFTHSYSSLHMASHQVKTILDNKDKITYQKLKRHTHEIHKCG
jgi:hypothetical protein